MGVSPIPREPGLWQSVGLERGVPPHGPTGCISEKKEQRLTMYFMDWLVEYEVFDNSLLAWGTALLIFLVASTLLGIARRVVRARLRTLAERHRAGAVEIADSVARATQGWFVLLVAVFLAAQSLDISPRTATVLGHVVTIGLLIQLGLCATVATAAFLAQRRARQLAEDPGAVATMDILGFVLRVAIWSFILLLTLDNLGVDITALVAGLGVGGIAVALAAQNILGDLFASLSIVLDKPFVVGDFIILGDYMGSVEKVGLKTTRVRSLSGEQLIFSNADLLSSRIRNYGRMFERRVVFTLGVTYQTSAEQLRRIPQIIREAVEANERVRFDRAHFQRYGDYALVFEVVFYVLSPDYNVYMDIQQAVNLTVFERFAAEGIGFAYPTQTLYLTRASQVPAAANAAHGT